MSLSSEQIKNFDGIKNEFLRRYNRAQVYHRSFPPQDEKLNPISGPFWTNTVDAMEPLANMFKELDLKEVKDTKQLEDLAHQWSTTMANMAQVYNWLDNQRAYDGAKYTDVAYDDVWDNMDRLDDVANQFFAELGLNQQQEKSPQKKEYVKPETNVEQLEKSQKIVSTPDAPHKPDLQKEQKKEDVAQEPIDAMKREDVVHAKADVAEAKKDVPQKNHKAAIAELRQIVDMFDRQNSDESFKKMMFALKKVADDKLVPDEMVDAYRAVFDSVKKHGNTERGIFDLSTELYNQIDELKTMDEKNSNISVQETAYESGLEKKQQNKDLGQKPEDLMKREERQKTFENFVNGNKKVQEMDKEHEAQRQKNNELALAVYRRKILQGRKSDV